MLDNAVNLQSRYSPRGLLYFLLCFSVSLIGTGWADYILMSQDMASIVEFAQEMLRGKRLYVDLITSQPPLIMYLTMPALGIHTLTGIPIPEAFLLFLFLLFQGCVLLSWRIARRNTLCRTEAQSYLILLALYCGVFILPSVGQRFLSTFSQREHLFCTLILPYIMLMLNRLQGQEGSRGENIAAGILGAIGFCIKPHFALVFIFSEFFLVITERRFLAWNRLDALLIMSLSLCYCLFIIFCTPEYLNLIPRFVLDYKGYESLSWEPMFYNVDLSIVVPVIIVFRMRHSLHFKIVLFLLVLICAGEVIFFAPKLFYFYHLFPVFFFSLLLFTFAKLASKEVKRMYLIMPLYFFYIFMQTDPVHVQHIIKRREEILSEAAILSQYKTICAFNTDNMLYFPMVIYAGAEWAMSPVYLEYLPNAYMRWSRVYKGQEAPYHSLEEMGENERFFHEIIIKDLQRLPDAIIIDESPLKPGFFKMRFDYLHYFMQDPRFREIWSHYELVTRVHRKYSASSNDPIDSGDAIYRRRD